MMNRKRLTTKFCILGTTVEDVAKIHGWAKDPARAYNIVAVAAHDVDNDGHIRSYEVRVTTKARALLDFIVEIWGTHVAIFTTHVVVGPESAGHVNERNPSF